VSRRAPLQLPLLPSAGCSSWTEVVAGGWAACLTIGSGEPPAARLWAKASVICKLLLMNQQDAGGYDTKALSRNGGGVPSAAVVRRIEIAVDYIDRSLEGDLSLRHVAHRVHLSRFHFARLFKHVTGTTLHAYVTERRLQRAHVLLCEGRYAMCEVALMCGLSSQAHLCTLFKRRFGLTPGQCTRARESHAQVDKRFSKDLQDALP
jgi:AraC-like DNA-binding protein